MTAEPFELTVTIYSPLPNFCVSTEILAAPFNAFNAVLYTSFPVKSMIEIATSAALFPVNSIVAFQLAGFGLTLNVLIVLFSEIEAFEKFILTIGVEVV